LTLLNRWKIDSSRNASTIRASADDPGLVDRGSTRSRVA
jgi:hypothetical protein